MISFHNLLLSLKDVLELNPSPSPQRGLAPGIFSAPLELEEVVQENFS
jgi:hypothetical protein